jgi:predicted nucleotidyltransferase
MNKKTDSKIEVLLNSLQQAEPLRIYLFGSWARGEMDEFSDIDVVVIMHTELPFLERALTLSLNLPLTLGGVDLLVYTPEEWQTMRENGNAFVETVLEEGQVIYEQTQS